MIRIVYLAAGLTLLLTFSGNARAGIETFIFDFENQPATAGGALTSLSLTKKGLSITIDRAGQTFDVADLAGLKNSAPFGARSLAPTPMQNNLFNVNFSRPVSRFSADFVDSTGESPDALALTAFSGQSGTGKNIGTVFATLPLNPDASLAFKTLQISGSGIQSVEFIGGTVHAPNSVFYDNFRVGIGSAGGSSSRGSAVSLPPALYVTPFCVFLGWMAAKKLRSADANRDRHFRD
jgi:hypothetical protein